MSNFITIPGFSKLTRQDIFDMAVAHIGKTQVKSKDDNSARCIYSGTGCNAAPLIRPEYHLQADAIGGWTTLLEQGKVPQHLSAFIDGIQHAHDGANSGDGFIVEWKANMRFVAGNKLDTSKLDAIED